jgi:hypothetical protein
MWPLESFTPCSPKKTDSVIPFVLDCIGSRAASLAPIAQVAQMGTTVAIVLPVILRDASDTVPPEYSLDAQAPTDWAEGVIVRGIRTHSYLQVSLMHSA